ncbi:MAG: PepSY domain-containing protein [Bdellovibrio sp.]
MRKLLVIPMVFAMGSVALAKKDCTDQPKEKWMKEADFKKKMETEGYRIRKFKTPGSCYEIYGTNKEGKKVEIYFNPVDASIVKSEVEEED